MLDGEQAQCDAPAEIGRDHRRIGHHARGSPSAMMRPASMQISRSATCSRIWTICSIQTMAMPRRCSSRMVVDQLARLARRSGRRRSRRAAARPGWRRARGRVRAACGRAGRASRRGGWRRAACRRARARRSRGRRLRRDCSRPPLAAATKTFSNTVMPLNGLRDLMGAHDAEPAALGGRQARDIGAAKADRAAASAHARRRAR